jgi:hypothetical protein
VSLGVYELLNTLIFAGIDPEVRKQLHFSFRDHKVQDLQQVHFLVANDGERAISSIIEPLTLVLPRGVKLLDGSILHRHPKALDVYINTDERRNALEFRCPLLSKGEFFVVKLLLDGKIPRDQLQFRVLADDLPRTLKLQWLPPRQFGTSGPVLIGNRLLSA